MAHIMQPQPSDQTELDVKAHRASERKCYFVREKQLFDKFSVSDNEFMHSYQSAEIKLDEHNLKITVLAVCCIEPKELTPPREDKTRTASGPCNSRNNCVIVV